jgi:hypothetical protein
MIDARCMDFVAVLMALVTFALLIFAIWLLERV